MEIETVVFDMIYFISLLFIFLTLRSHSYVPAKKYNILS